MSIFFLNGCGSHFVSNGFIPKVIQGIKKSWRTTLPDLKAIQPTVHKVSCLQAFLAVILENRGFWLGAKKNKWEELPCHIGQICEK